MQGVAQNLNDPMLRYNTATLTANISEKVRILAENGQIPLAYMTAKSHGLEEFAKTLETTLIESDEFDHERIFKEASKFISADNSKAKALLPLRPIFTKNETFASSDWPMINMRAKEAERAAQVFRRKKAEAAETDIFFDAKEHTSSNQSVANILSNEPSKANTEADSSVAAAPESQAPPIEEATLEAADWGDNDEDIDIDMGDDLGGAATDKPEEAEVVDEDSDLFVPPS